MKTKIQTIFFCLILHTISYGQYSQDVIYNAESGFEPLRITLADFNNDGNKEVISYKGMLNFRQNKQLFSGWLFIGASPEGAHDITTGDLNNDGFPDVLATSGNLTFEETYKSYYFLNNGNSNIVHNVVQPIFLPQWYQEQIRAADFDGDGLTDIIRSDGLVTDDFYESWSLRASRNVDGGQTWVNYNLPFPPSNQNISNIVVGDVNGDALPDVVCNFAGAPGVSGCFVYFNTSTPGAISFAPAVPIGAQGFFPEAIADLDGDGLPDIAGYHSSGSFQWRKNTGGGTFSTESNIILQLPQGIVIFRKLQVGDLDNDGDIDVVVAVVSSNFPSAPLRRVIMIDNVGSGNFELLAEYNVGSFINDLDIGDVTNDGFEDIVVSTNSDIQLFRLESTCTATSLQGYSTVYSPEGVHVSWPIFIGAKSCVFQFGILPNTLLLSGLLSGDEINNVFLPNELFIPGVVYFNFGRRCSCSEDGSNLPGWGATLIINNPLSGLTANQNLSLWPNPGKGEISIKATIPGYKVRVHDISGRLIYSEYTNSEMLRIPEGKLTPGVYIVQAGSENFNSSHKLIITD